MSKVFCFRFKGDRHFSYCGYSSYTKALESAKLMNEEEFGNEMEEIEVGILEPVDIKGVKNFIIDHLEDEIGDYLFGKYGEESANKLIVTQEASNELSSFLELWMNKYENLGLQDVGKIINIKKFSLD